MNFKRIFSALIGFPIIAVILIFGNKYVVDIAFSIIAGISLYEYLHSFKLHNKSISIIAYISAILLSFIHVIPYEYMIKIMSIIFPVFILILFFQVIITNMKYNIKDIAIVLFGICYISILLSFIPILSESENGKIIVWFIFSSAWGTDIFAYFIGKKFGKHKFSKISPNKSIEGCIAGLFGAITLSVIYALICNTYLGMNFNYLYIILISIALSIIGQIGDFAASSIKRYTEVKDFGNLIPGHGGMLDRFDSVIFIAPFAYFLLMLL